MPDGGGLAQGVRARRSSAVTLRPVAIATRRTKSQTGIVMVPFILALLFEWESDGSTEGRLEVEGGRGFGTGGDKRVPHF